MSSQSSSPLFTVTCQLSVVNINNASSSSRGRRRVYIPSHVYSHPCALLLDKCSSLSHLRQILPLVFKHSLSSDLFFQTKLLSLFCNFRSLHEASLVFDPIDNKLDVLYHTLLKAHAHHSSLHDALLFYARMLGDGVAPVAYTFTYLLKACGDSSDFRRAREVHAQLLATGHASTLFGMTGVVNMYAKCGRIGDACKMFDRMPERDLVSWNAIVSGCARNGMGVQALELVSRMQEEGMSPDSVTVVSVLPAVAGLGSLRIGRSVHGYVLRNGLESFVNVLTSLVDMYSKCGSVGTARLVFDRMKRKSDASWNSMIDGYVASKQAKEAMVIFRKMLDEGVEPTDVSIMKALNACADLGDLEQGIHVHKLSDGLQLSSDVSVANSLISMYSKCKRIDVAADIFDRLQGKTRVSWNAMILGYAQNGRVNEALDYFCKMQSLNIKPDSFSMVSVITAIAELSVVRHTKWIHGLVIRSYLDSNVFVMTALVDMYAKCGSIDTSRKLFDMMNERHVITWNAMIDGYGTHGLGKAAVDLFNDMQKEMTRPNDITFLCILSACSHSGMVDEGLHIFETMKKDYGLEPAMDHYGAMVDLLGRSGRLNEAWDFIQKMPVEPGINVYGAMLGACKIHNHAELGEKAADRLFELNPEEGGYHVLLANIYAAASMWDKVVKVRNKMERSGLRKTPGCSLVELRNEVHSFYSGSTNHPQSERIYAHLERLGDEIKAAGYIPDTNSIHDVEDDIKEQLLSSHSEKLAISFALLNTKPGATIHVRKNLRVCGDCHSATKYISLVTGREIIVRDMQRFHHFKNGTCSCGDYW